MSNAEVRIGDCRDVMRSLPPDSVDSIVTDPPYGLAFMGKEWDHGVPGVEFWTEALRVAKPGAHLVAFGGTRTFHRLTVAIEDAGWEVRDCLSWLYGTGFPKSHNGLWGGTALKPAWEPIVLARKPLVGTVAANVTHYGTGGINVNATRIGERWPANVCLDEDAAALLDEQSGVTKSSGGAGTGKLGHRIYGEFANTRLASNAGGLGDSGGASRFFYTAKASRREREAGLEGMPEKRGASTSNGGVEGRLMTVGAASLKGEPTEPPASRNHHPTVKPIALMRWLCRLVTQPNGLVLDPFNGSGSTGCAAVLEGFRYLGAELDAEYVEIARKRIAYWDRQRNVEGDA